MWNAVVLHQWRSLPYSYQHCQLQAQDESPTWKRLTDNLASIPQQTSVWYEQNQKKIGYFWGNFFWHTNMFPSFRRSWTFRSALSKVSSSYVGETKSCLITGVQNFLNTTESLKITRIERHCKRETVTLENKWMNYYKNPKRTNTKIVDVNIELWICRERERNDDWRKRDPPWWHMRPTPLTPDSIFPGTIPIFPHLVFIF